MVSAFSLYTLLKNSTLEFYYLKGDSSVLFFIVKLPEHQHLLGGIGYGKNEESHRFKHTDKGSIQEFPFVEEILLKKPNTRTCKFSEYLNDGRLEISNVGCCKVLSGSR